MHFLYPSAQFIGEGRSKGGRKALGFNSKNVK